MKTIMHSEHIRFVDSESIQRVEILCDTAADLPTASEVASGMYAAGSLALIASEHEIMILNNEGEWV